MPSGLDRQLQRQRHLPFASGVVSHRKRGAGSIERRLLAVLDRGGDAVALPRLVKLVELQIEERREQLKGREFFLPFVAW